MAVLTLGNVSSACLRRGAADTRNMDGMTVWVTADELDIVIVFENASRSEVAEILHRWMQSGVKTFSLGNPPWTMLINWSRLPVVTVSETELENTPESKPAVTLDAQQFRA